MAKGRPPTYKTAQELQAKIDAYFDDCKGEMAVDEDGDIVYTKSGMPCYKRPPRPPGMVELALWLGFKSRQSFGDYSKRSADLSDAITRARSRVEAYAEQRLYDRDGQKGAEFNLRCNFGWGSDADADTAKLDAILSEVRKDADAK